eukprot:gene7754-9092_t
MNFYKDYKNDPTIGSTSKFYNIVMTSLKNMQATEEQLIEVYQDYKNTLEPQDTDVNKQYIYNTMMSYYCNLANVDKVEELFAKLPKPSPHSYTIVINTFVAAAQIDRALAMLAKFHENFSVDASAYNMLLCKLADKRQFTMCEAIIDEMRRQKIKFDKIAYTSMIIRYARSDNGALLEALLNDLMNDNDIVMDAPLFSAIIEALATAESHDRSAEAIAFFEGTPNAGELMNEWVFYHMLGAYPAPKARELWATYHARPGLAKKRSFERYTLILYRSNEPATGIMDLYNLAKQMHPTHYEKNPFFFNMLIKSMIREDKLADAWALFQYLIRQRIASSDTFFIMVSHLCGSASLPIVKNNIREILISSHFAHIEVNRFRFWSEIYKELVSTNNYSNLLATIDLMKTCTSDPIASHASILYPYLISKDSSKLNVDAILQTPNK